jgi:hypothetical protein
MARARRGPGCSRRAVRCWVDSSTVRTRFATRLAVIAIGAAVPVLVTAAPALAKVNPDDGEVRGPSLGLGNTILLFVVVPIAAFLLISALALLPSALSRPRYRPGKPWDHEPRWVGRAGAPDDRPADPTARGGASAEW